jgi:hypothetical protein
MKGRRVTLGLRGLVGLGLLWIVASRVELARLRDALALSEPGPMVAGVALLLAAGVQIVRLHVLVQPLLSRASDSVRITMGSFFFNQVLPGGLGGEVYRAVRLRGSSDRWSPALALILVERLIGAAVLVVPALVCVLATWTRLSNLARARWPVGERAWAGRSMVPFLVLAALALAVASFLAISEKVRRRFRQVESSLATQVSRLEPSRLWAAAVTSVVYHLLRVLGFAAFARAVHERLAWTDWIIVLAVTLVVSLLPLSLGGLGLKEGAIVSGLMLFGVGEAEALLVALLNRGVLVGLALVGGGVLLAGRRREVLPTHPEGE